MLINDGILNKRFGYSTTKLQKKTLHFTINKLRNRFKKRKALMGALANPKTYMVEYRVRRAKTILKNSD